MKLKIARNQSFVNSLAKEVYKLSKNKTKVISVSANNKDVVKGAIETAKAYWLSGWSFDEIHARLEEEYTDSIADSALKYVSKYVEKVTKNGPFSVGQKLKIKNGEVVRVTRVDKSKVVATDKDGKDAIFDISTIGKKASMELKKAHQLREKAKQILKAAEPKKYIIPETPPQKWEEHSETPGVSEEVYKTKVQKSTPSGWADIAPEIGEVEEIDQTLQESINNILGLEELSGELQSQISEANKKLRSIRDQSKSLKAEQQDELKKLFLLSNSIHGGLDTLDRTVFGDYKNKIVGLRSKVREEPLEPGVKDELVAIKEILKTNHARIAKKVFEALDEYMEAFTTIDRQMENTFAHFEYRDKPKKKKSQLVQKFVNFFKSVYSKIENATKSILNTVVPETEEVINAISDIEKNMVSAAITKHVESMYRSK